MAIDQERRNMLIAKYGIDNAPNPRDPIATAVLDGERTLAKMCNWGPGIDLGPLFDPVWSPEMHQIADRAMRQLHADMARGEIDYDGGVEYARNRGTECDPDQIEDGVLLVNYVGHDGVQVVRGGEGQHFAALFQATWRLVASARTPHDCVVRLAPECRIEPEKQRAMEFWPLLRGQFLLLFTICSACRDHAIQIAGDGYKLAEIATHEQLAAQLASAKVQPEDDQGGGWWARAWAAVVRAVKWFDLTNLP